MIEQLRITALSITIHDLGIHLIGQDTHPFIYCAHWTLIVIGRARGRRRAAPKARIHYSIGATRGHCGSSIMYLCGEPPNGN